MTHPPVIAVCEDDADIRELLAAFLSANGFDVETAGDTARLDCILTRRDVSLVILDWMLPGENGLDACRRLRAAGGPPVILLTARDEDADRISGLDGGADDYVSKPFNPAVLLARVRAVLRRSGIGTAGETLALADLTINVEARTVTIGRANVPPNDLPLSSAEFDLLLCFVRAPQRVLSRDQLLDLTRGRTADLFDRTIDMQVSRLRRRLEDAGSEVAGLIRTIRNAGYMLATTVRRV